MDWSLFDEVGDALRGMLPDELSDFRHRAQRYGIKVWFGGATATREHYEAQVIGPDAVPAAKVLALEVGFHSEHADRKANEAVVARLLARERSWRKVLGKDTVAGPFLGRADAWRRVSETWPDPNLGEPQLALELAGRLHDYISAFEPVLRGTDP